MDTQTKAPDTYDECWSFSVSAEPKDKAGKDRWASKILIHGQPFGTVRAETMSKVIMRTMITMEDLKDLPIDFGQVDWLELLQERTIGLKAGTGIVEAYVERITTNFKLVLGKKSDRELGVDGDLIAVNLFSDAINW